MQIIALMVVMVVAMLVAVMMIVIMVMAMMMAVVVMPAFQLGPTLSASANAAHHTTSISRMVISSPPVTCN